LKKKTATGERRWIRFSGINKFHHRHICIRNRVISHHHPSSLLELVGHHYRVIGGWREKIWISILLFFNGFEPHFRQFLFDTFLAFGTKVLKKLFSESTNLGKIR
jgi:hypothetical protein